MKKEYIFLSFSLKDSSVNTMFSTLCNDLSKKYEVVVVTDNTSHTERINDKIQVFKWPSPRPTRIKDFRFLIKLIKKYRPTVMVSMFGSDNIFLLGGFLCGVKHRISWSHTISTARSNNSKYLVLRKRVFFKMATNFVANSNAMKEDLIEVYKIDQEKIRIFYNVVERIDIDNERDFNTVSFAGRLHPAKGLDVLIKAIKLVSQEYPDIKLNILGGDLKGMVIKDYIRLVKELKIERNINFLGHQSKNELLQIFSKSLAVIVPSFFEAFGLVVIEAFSVKTPVIGSNTGGIKEIVRDEKDGFLVEPKNVEELSEKIIYMLNNKQQFAKLSGNCHKRFLSEFELDNGTKKISQYINTLIEGKQ